ncbi:hypothetical protein PUR61_24835 [Streptomyces sp. BE20]|uniref:hypothetical protein n=1 Tax=Streptomyces sp. BE20 TaxID=3002525 RepID=UPI002E7792F3|nr:hypothetical protein [Streptomyces sp. BE20]MEE1825383.1 hypothetical protein [Streptomyces sp. BE20]
MAERVPLPAPASSGGQGAGRVDSQVYARFARSARIDADLLLTFLTDRQWRVGLVGHLLIKPASPCSGWATIMLLTTEDLVVLGDPLGWVRFVSAASCRTAA